MCCCFLSPLAILCGDPAALLSRVPDAEAVLPPIPPWLWIGARFPTPPPPPHPSYPISGVSCFQS